VEKKRRIDTTSLTVGEVARLLDRSVQRVRAYERDGRLRATRIGRLGIRVFDADDVERLRGELAKQQPGRPWRPAAV
jgi:DNA-binding transcriptional MerR regulator